MTVPFLHDFPDWDELVRVVAGEMGLDPPMVEKDYWVVHCLRAIQQMGWGIRFKGGTSLSKGYGIIQRFSEDLDLRVDPSAEWALPDDHNWRSAGRASVGQRRAYFRRIAKELRIPGCQTAVVDEDRHFRAIKIRAEYREVTGAPPKPLSGGVLLEPGNARVAPAEACAIQSWVSEKASQKGIVGFLDLPLLAVDCIRPEVTLLEKIEAIVRRYPRQMPASKIIRHYEDCASIINYLKTTPGDGAPMLRDLYGQMLETRDLQLDYAADLQLFAFEDSVRNDELKRAWNDASAMHWGGSSVCG